MRIFKAAILVLFILASNSSLASDTEALQIIKQGLTRGEQFKGLFESTHVGTMSVEASILPEVGFPFPKAKFSRIEGTKIYYETWATKNWTVDDISVRFIANDVHASAAMTQHVKRVELVLDLSQLKLVRVQKPLKKDDQMYKIPTGTRLVWLKQSIKRHVAVELPADKIDSFVEAASTIAPRAKVKIKE